MSDLLMVTPYPPYRDGIGTYAVQEVRRLRGEGLAVEVLSPLPSAAHHHLALGNLRGVMALVKRARRHPRTMIQFSPEMFFGACRGPAERVAVWGGLALLARVTELEIRLHEIEFGPLANNPAERVAAGRALQAAAVVSVHTRPEIDRLAQAVGLDPAEVTLVEHGRHFVPQVAGGRQEARVELGLDPDRHVFVAIGFLQEHKGFDRAAEAFRAAGLSRQAELHIVGSVRVNHPDLVAYARSLERLCRSTAGVELHQRYVSDEEFDRWILAADTVVLPYREIWSSSVLERAKLFDRPIVAADVGGLGDQAVEGTLLFDDDESLVQCLKERAATTIDRLPTVIVDAASADGDGQPVIDLLDDPWPVDGDRPDRRRLEAEFRRRARAARGLSAGDSTGSGVVVSSDPEDGPAGSLLALPPLLRPTPTSARPGVGAVKRLLRRLVNWELEPVVTALSRLQVATTEAALALATEGAGPTAGDAAPESDDVSLVENPFVHGAVADLPPGARLALVGGGGSRLARALEASGYVLTVLAVDDVVTGSAPTGPRGYDAVIVPSPSAALLSARNHDWPQACAALVGTPGRLVISRGDLVDAEAGLDGIRAAAADAVPSLAVGFVGSASRYGDRWLVDGPGSTGGAGGVASARLALVIHTARA